MSDPNFWKNQYRATWSQSKTKEDAIARLIEAETGRKVEVIGLGAGSDQYLPGSAAAQGHERGGADLAVQGTRVRLEVTGPLVASIDATAALWIRPDKVRNAEGHWPEVDTWVIHHLAKDNTLRVVHLDVSFFTRFKRGDFATVHPTIRGTQETYLAIPANDPVVQPFDTLIQYLRRL